MVCLLQHEDEVPKSNEHPAAGDAGNELQPDVVGAKDDEALAAPQP